MIGFVVRDLPWTEEKKSVSPTMDEWYPIQVKQPAKVGRPDMDAFEAVLIREERMLGYFVGFEFSRDAPFEIDCFCRTAGCKIKALTVREVLDQELSGE